MKKLKLFCFPYAGGSATIYEDWKSFPDTKFEVRPVELAARGIRLGDKPYDSLDEAVDDAFQIIQKEIIDNDYAIFGHSLGATIAYRLASKIKKLNVRQPQHLFFSGQGAPNVVELLDKRYHLLNDVDFKKKMIELGGTTEEFFKYPELLELFIPIIKNDCKLAYTPVETEVNPFECEISILLGKDEEVSADQVFGWRAYTTKTCSIYFINGNHFFINQEMKEVLKVIKIGLQPK